MQKSRRAHWRGRGPNAEEAGQRAGNDENFSSHGVESGDDDDDGEEDEEGEGADAGYVDLNEVRVGSSVGVQCVQAPGCVVCACSRMLIYFVYQLPTAGFAMAWLGGVRERRGFGLRLSHHGAGHRRRRATRKVAPALRGVFRRQVQARVRYRSRRSGGGTKDVPGRQVPYLLPRVYVYVCICDGYVYVIYVYVIYVDVYVNVHLRATVPKLNLKP